MSISSFVDRFSVTSPASQLRKARNLLSEDDDFSDARWGSEAGFGSIAKGVPTFTLPDVADVSAAFVLARADLLRSCHAACGIFKASHR